VVTLIATGDPHAAYKTAGKLKDKKWALDCVK
jgi:hypothetical protein